MTSETGLIFNFDLNATLIIHVSHVALVSLYQQKFYAIVGTQFIRRCTCAWNNNIERWNERVLGNDYISFVFVVISVLYIFYIARNCRIASLSKMTMPLNKQSCSDQLFQREFSLPNAGGAIHVINFTSLCYELHFQQHVETFNILLLHTKQIQICLIP